MTERKSISETVKEFYQLRSKISHGGVTVLQAEDRELVFNVGSLLEQALINEIRAY